MNYLKKADSIKRDSFSLTGEYLKLLFAEVRLRDEGPDATVSDINRANEIRMEINAANEVLRRHVRSVLKLDNDPDLDRY